MRYIQYQRARAIGPLPVRWHSNDEKLAEIQQVTEWITISEADAIKAYRATWPERNVSDFVALDGYMSKCNARFAAAPIGKGVELSEFMAKFVRECDSTNRAAAKLNIHPNVVRDVLSGKRKKLPSYVLKALGVEMVVTLMATDEAS